MAEKNHRETISEKMKKKGRTAAGVQTVTEQQRDSRLVIMFGVFMLVFIVVACRLGYIQIVKADEYTARAVSKQTKTISVTSERGIIYDANGKALALNEPGYTVSVAPAVVKEQEQKKKGYTKKLARQLAKIIPDMTQKQIYNKLKPSKSSYVTVAKYINKKQYNKIRKMVDNKEAIGISLDKTTRRYYTLGEFASHILGITNDQNNGVFGIEQYYDRYLKGEPGRIISSTDASGRTLNGGIRSYYEGSEGLDIVLTVDEVIQHYVEDALKQVYVDTNADRVMAIAMNPKTGAVLAMADYPDFNLNDPRTPLDEEEQQELEEMTDAEKVQYWNGTMWRNPLVNDIYEPGSPFKLLTTSMALEENKTSVSDSFFCGGTVYVSGQPLNCWRSYAPHGGETLSEGVANSCNPVFITLARRLGLSRFYSYLERYGMDSRTGIDLPGEAYGLLQDQNKIGQVELATMSYGQGIAVTPIQMLTALASLGNEGKMMKPYVVQKMIDSKGNTVNEVQPHVIRQVVSKETSREICTMMEGVVRNGTGSAAYIPGYRIGGKTGTAQKVEDGKYTEYTDSSFFAMAPMDDPQFAVLFIVDSPKGVHTGGKTAGPGVHMIMSNCLKYLNVTPVYTDDNEANAAAKVTVPDLGGIPYRTAEKTLKDLGLSAIACPSGTEDFRVVSQYPEAQTQISPGDSVCLYAYD